MNLFQLVFKQMRQRALGTWLTMLSVLLGVALAVAIFLMQQAGSALFAQTDYGFDVLVGIGQGSALDLTLNTVYHIFKSPGNVPYWVYETLDTPTRPPRGSHEFNYNEHVKTAIPIAVGDTYSGGWPIVASPPKMFVSLAQFRTKISDLRDQQRALMNDVKAGRTGDVAAFASRQSALQPAVQNLRAEMKSITQATTPLLEQMDSRDPSASPSADDAKWKYGKPVTFKADAAVSEATAASASLSAKDAAGAIAHQQAVLDGLDAVYNAAGAENGPLEYRPDMHYEIAQGRIYHAWKFEAIIGSEVERNTNLKLGSIFQATHGNPRPNEKPDIHKEKWQVVGVMAPTHTSADRCVYIPLVSFYCIAEHEPGIEQQNLAREGKSGGAAPPPDDDDVPKFKYVYGDDLDPDLPHTNDFISIDLPKQKWLISAILIKSRGGIKADDLMYFIRAGGMHENVQAINPAGVMRVFFDTFFASSTMILLVIAALVSVVAAVGILVSIYNSVSARNREIAILRALGATRGRVLTLICLEAGLIGLFGGLLGLLVGHLIGGVGSYYLSQQLGQGFNWISTSKLEWLYLLCVVLIALGAGLVPAAKAYRTPVATNLVAA